MGFISGIKYKYSRKSAENPFPNILTNEQSAFVERSGLPCFPPQGHAGGSVEEHLTVRPDIGTDLRVVKSTPQLD